MINWSMIILQTFAFAVVSFIVLSILTKRKGGGKGGEKKNVLELPKQTFGWRNFLYPHRI